MEEPVDARDLLEIWNHVATDALPQVTSLPPTRRSKLEARLKAPERTRAWWLDYFTRIRSSPLCCGQNDRGWRATLDWAVRSEDVVAKVLEGNYDARGSPGALDGWLAEQARKEAVG
ncbi:MAG: hypothetical protein WDA71_13535 [Actinomycetota bacterium]